MSPVPARESWLEAQRARPLFRALGIRGDDIGDGYAQYLVLPAGGAAGGRGAPSSFALTCAADQCILGAAVTTVDPAREQMNGTAEMNLTYLEQPHGAVTVRGEVIHRGERLRLVALELRDAGGRLVAQGRGTYSIRPEPWVEPPAAAAGAGRP